ncbi:hypothetical protein TrST_g2188 [Triparma strigata]|uniref:Uncharacterized protein n=1 Tax=Triparma strigata TaxID=1606541 RepID=A0A9W7C036_9STRA|nr:hypothetical protein TrST_g2188 [Triparma strigata]
MEESIKNRRSKLDKAPPPPTSECTIETLPSILQGALPHCTNSLLPSATSALLRPLIYLHLSSTTSSTAPPPAPLLLRSDLSTLPLPTLIEYFSTLQPPLASYLLLVHLERHFRHLFFHTAAGLDGSLYNSAKSPTLLKVFNVTDSTVHCESEFGEDIELKTPQCTYLKFDDDELQSLYDRTLTLGSKLLFSLISSQTSLELLDVPDFKEIQPCVDIFQLGSKTILRVLHHLSSYPSILLKVKCHVNLNHYARALKLCSENASVDKVDALKDKVLIWEDRHLKKDRKLAKKLGKYVTEIMEKNNAVI